MARLTAEQKLQKQAEYLKSTPLVPTREVVLACASCGQWLVYRLVSVSTNTVEDEEGTPVSLAELTCITEHGCLRESD